MGPRQFCFQGRLLGARGIGGRAGGGLMALVAVPGVEGETQEAEDEILVRAFAENVLGSIKLLLSISSSSCTLHNARH